MSRIRCFWLEPTDQVRVGLRRYLGDTQCDKAPHGYHQAINWIDDRPAIWEQRVDGGKCLDTHKVPDEDPRWPTRCVCGHPFDADQYRQVFQELIYRRADTGELLTLRDAPVGAMWNAWWLADRTGSPWSGPDGLSLHVKTPGGDWCIDSRANNCTLPDDRVHKCWIRHGTPPDITVDKNGHTCSAGAGSILCGSYHGFLRAGYLEGC